MNNYFSKYSIEQIDQETIPCDLQSYRRYYVILTTLIYLIVFGVINFDINQSNQDILVKGLILVAGFSIHTALQFHFTKQLKKQAKSKIPVSQLMSTRNRYEPKIIFLAIFLGLYFAQEQLPISLNMATTGLLVIALIQLLLQLRQDESV